MGGLRILSDRDDRRIFWGLKFSNSGFYLARRILASIFLGSLIEVRIFGGVVLIIAFWNVFFFGGG